MIVSVVPVATPNSRARPGPLISPSANRRVSCGCQNTERLGHVLEHEGRAVTRRSDVLRIQDVATPDLLEVIQPAVQAFFRFGQPACQPVERRDLFVVQVRRCRWCSSRDCCRRVSSSSTTSAIARCSFCRAEILSRSNMQNTVSRPEHDRSIGAAVAEGFEPPDGVSRLSLSRRVH